MKFQKLRGDILRKLSPVRLILVNADVLHHKGGNSDFAHAQISDLAHEGVEIVVFSAENGGQFSEAPERGGIELHPADADFYSRIKAERALLDSEIAFLGASPDDMPIIEKVAFSTATADAPLDVKSKSYYIAYGTGGDALGELADLILRAKRNGNGT